MYVLECARSMSWSSRTGPSRDVDAHIPQSRDQGLRRSPSRERQPGRGRVLTTVVQVHMLWLLTSDVLVARICDNIALVETDAALLMLANRLRE